MTPAGWCWPSRPTARPTVSRGACGIGTGCVASTCNALAGATTGCGRRTGSRIPTRRLPRSRRPMSGRSRGPARAPGRAQGELHRQGEQPPAQVAVGRVTTALASGTVGSDASSADGGAAARASAAGAGAAGAGAAGTGAAGAGDDRARSGRLAPPSALPPQSEPKPLPTAEPKPLPAAEPERPALAPAASRPPREPVRLTLPGPRDRT